MKDEIKNKNHSLSIKLKVYTFWLLQVVFYYSPFRLFFMRLYVKSFYNDWMGEPYALG